MTALGAALAVLLTACTALQPRDFAGATPVLDPQAFFAGHTRSWGVFENPGGQPTRRFTTACDGHWEGKILVLDQTFTYDNGETQHRHWRISRLDAHRYTATANDVSGDATGTAYGNAFHWQYVVELKPGNLLYNVQLEQWMYLQPDGSLLNRGTISKLGVRLAQVTEEFHRGR